MDIHNNIRRFILAFITICVTACGGDTAKEPHPEQSPPQWPSSPITVNTLDSLDYIYAAQFGDMDGDGMDDLVLSGRFKNRLYIYKATAPGNYILEQRLPTKTYAKEIHLTDLDGDKYLDILILDNDGAVSWFPMNPDQNPSEQQLFAEISGSSLAVQPVDIDGDADIDIIATNTYINKISYFENTGEGNFQERTLAESDYHLTFALGDINGDGFLDAVTGSTYQHEDEHLVLYQNNGDTTYTRQVIEQSEITFDFTEMADFDGDGRLDILARSSENSLLSWYKNNGDQTFTKQLLEDSLTVNSSIKVVDFDSDGDTDILAGGGAGLYFYQNDGSGVFQKSLLQSESTQLLAISDISGLGDKDILIYNNELQWLQWGEISQVLEQEHVQSTASALSNSGADLSYELTALSSPGFSINSQSGTVMFTAPPADQNSYPNGEQNFIAWIVARDGSSGIGRKWIVQAFANDDDDDNDGIADINDAFPLNKNEHADFDGDGLGDAADTDDDNDSVPDKSDPAPYNASMFSKPTWQEPVQHKFKAFPHPASTPRNLYTVDFDLDSDDDFIGTEYNGSSILVWYESTANGQLIRKEIANVNFSARSLLVEDVDNDKDMDIISITHDGLLFLHQNIGQFQFTAHALTTKSTAGPSDSIYAMDVDGDGYKDILLAEPEEDGHSIYWYQNSLRENSSDYQLQFEKKHLHELAKGKNTAADMDGDGDQDIVVLQSELTQLIWFENLGGAAFSPHLIHEARSNIGFFNIDLVSFCIGDINGDGNQDLAAHFGALLPLNIFINSGNGEFSQYEGSFVDQLNSAPNCKDINHDGASEVLLSYLLRSPTQDNQYFVGALQSTRLAQPSDSANIQMDWLVNIPSHRSLSFTTADIIDSGIQEFISMDTTNDSQVVRISAGDSILVNESEHFSTEFIAQNMDGKPISYSLIPGADSHLFTINPQSGRLDFHTPTFDADGANTYSVWIQAEDEFSKIQRLLTIHVYRDDDDYDDDGVLNSFDEFPLDNREQQDTDKDGIGDFEDQDDDGDGLLDDVDGSPLNANSSAPPNWKIVFAPELKMSFSDLNTGSQRAPQAIDFDDDGDIDLVTTRSSPSGQIILYENKEGHSFEKRTVVSTSVGNTLTVTDHNQDGLLDFLITDRNSGYGNISVFEQDATNNLTFIQRDHELVLPSLDLFATPNTEYTETRFYQLTTQQVDINGDGISDPMFFGYFDVTNSHWGDHFFDSYTDFPTMFWLLKGQSNVWHGQRLQGFSNGNLVHFVDIDIDGDTDMFSVENGTPHLVWLENTEANVLVKRSIAIPGVYGYSPDITAIQHADIDSDGDLDLLLSVTDRVAPNNITPRRTVVEVINNGNDFHARIIHRSEFGAPHSRGGDVIADIDSDGDLDILIRPLNDTVKWLQNTGRSSFVLTDLRIPTDSQTSILLEDIDKDGDPEIIATMLQEWGMRTYAQGGLYTVTQGQTLIIQNPVNEEYSGPLSYSIWRGNDAKFFSISTSTGELQFKGSASINSPEDANKDNIYEVWIAASDGFAEIHRKILVRVSD